MRTIPALLVSALLCVGALAAEEQFDQNCANGLAEFGVKFKTSCKVNWTDPDSGRMFCFSSEGARESFLRDPAANIRKAEKKYSELKEE